MELDELLQDAQLLSTITGGGDDNPKVCYTISQVLQQTQELHARVTQNGINVIEANTFLSSKGIDLSSLTQKLNNLRIPHFVEPCNTIEDFLKNERENAINSVIDKSSRIFKMGDVKAKCVQEKTILLSSLVGPSQEFIDLGSVSKQTVLDQKSVQRAQVNSFESSYAQAVIKYNITLIQSGYCQKLVKKFANVAKGFYDDKLNEMWSILMHMISVPSSSLNIDPMKRHKEPEKFVTHAKSFLESHFKLYMSSVVMANVVLEKYYGTPNIYNLIKGFVWVNYHANNLIGLVDIKNGMPLWPYVYYSLRCGEMETALKFLQSFDYQTMDLIQVIQDKIKHQEINARILEQLNLLYLRQIKNSTDPFKKASFCLIVGLDIHEPHSEVIRTIQDFLWLRLYILHNRQSICGCLNIEQFTFTGLQSLILEQYGECYFHASEQPHTFFQALMLTGQFEAAIEFLARLENYRSHAVHMALALNQVCALSTSRDVQSPLLFIDADDPRTMRRLNFARLIMMYAKSFENRITVTEALHYYSFLRKYKYCDGRDVFVTCVSDLAVKTLAFELIFGQLNQFTDLNCSTNTAAVMVAKKLVDHGMSENAVQLFQLSGMHEKALKILNGLLSQCVMEFPQPGTMRHRLTQTVQVYKERLETEEFIIEPQTKATFVLLGEILKFFNLYHKNKYGEAMECLENTNLIPAEMSDTDNCIHNIKHLSAEAYRVFPDVLVAVMNIYCEAYTTNKSILELEGIGIQLNSIQIGLRDRAKALNCLAVTIPNKMADRIIERLLKMGNSIN